MISVCLASYNGEKYIKQQLTSILSQISEKDEVLISDDGSSDNTISIIESFENKQIILFKNQFKSVVKNTEFLLKKTQGSIIFLSDQDDIWESNKISVMSSFLKQYDLVLSNFSLIDKFDNNINLSFKPRKVKNLILNIITNPYQGSCMAFNRKILDFALPFPSDIVLHDYWIGLITQANTKTFFIDLPLIKYRRHDKNLSDFQKSTNKLSFKLSYRFWLIFYLITRTLKYQFYLKIKKKQYNY